MKKTIQFIAGIAIILFVGHSCSPLLAPTITKHGDLHNYNYVYVMPTNSLTSSVGGGSKTTEEKWSGLLNSSSTSSSSSKLITKTINPKDVIVGILTKKGLVNLPEMRPDLKKWTLIVSYGQSGKRNTTFSYAIEVTIQFVSAETNALVFSCTAEGEVGDREVDADAINQAITRALDALFAPPPAPAVQDSAQRAKPKS